jgi:hypothetical protein
VSLTRRTRYVLLASLIVLLAGVGTGLVAYYMGGLPQVFQSAEPQELRYVPADAALVAYANVHDVMASELRQRIRQAVPVPGDGQREFQDRTGINIETDIDRVVASVGPRAGGGADSAGVLVLARGRFDEVKIEALMREHGASVEDYKGKRLIDHPSLGPGGAGFGLAFMEPGLVAVGSTPAVRAAIDLLAGGTNVMANDELMSQVRLVTGGQTWAVGRFDAMRENIRLPEPVARQIPAITWFSASSRIDGDLRANLRAEARDDEAAASLRQVVSGFVAMAKLQTGNRPELQSVVESIEIGGTGTTVTLSFAVPGEAFDALGAARPSAR